MSKMKRLLLLLPLCVVLISKAQNSQTTSSYRVRTVVVSLDTEAAEIAAKVHSNTETPFCHIILRWGRDTNWNLDSDYLKGNPQLVADNNINDYAFSQQDIIRSFKDSLTGLRPFTAYYVQAAIIYVHPPPPLTPQQQYNLQNVPGYTLPPTPPPFVDSVCAGKIVAIQPLSPASGLYNNNLLSGNQIICPIHGNYQPDTIYASLPKGGIGNYKYQWQQHIVSNPDSGFWNQAGGMSVVTNAKNYLPWTISSAVLSMNSGLYQMLFRRVVTSGSESDTSAPVMITFASGNTNENVNITQVSSYKSNMHKLILVPTMLPLYGGFTAQWEDSAAGSSGFSNIITGHQDTLIAAVSDTGVYYKVNVSYGNIGANTNTCQVFSSPVIGISPPDGDGNLYTTVSVGLQTWLAGNLRTTSFNNGTPITPIHDTASWAAVTNPAYCWYRNDSVGNATLYGALYNYYVITTNNENVCPIGWHVATSADWCMLFTSQNANGMQTAAGMLKSVSAPWTSPAQAKNTYGFSAAPGGDVSSSGKFENKYFAAKWWSVSKNATHFDIFNFSDRIFWTNDLGAPNYQNQGYSVRCVKNITVVPVNQ